MDFNVTYEAPYKYDITSTLPKSVKLDNKPVKCSFCERLFSAKQYLDGHLLFKHSTRSVAEEIQTENTTNRSSDATDEGTVTPPSATVIDEKDYHEKRRGSDQRKSYTLEYKMKTLKLLDSFTQNNTKNKWSKVADLQGISKSMVIKWNKERSKIVTELSLNKHNKNAGNIKELRQRRRLTAKKSTNREKYPLAAKLLVVEFQLRRATGSRVSKLWLCKKMKSKIEDCYGKEVAEKFKASSNWFQRFKKKHNISLRRRTNKKKDSANEGRATIQRFHRELRKAVQTTRRRNIIPVNRKYGRWLPNHRYNVDQVPLPFVIGQEKTYDISGSKQVWVSQPSSGLDKRQATLQLCIRASGEQKVKPAIVFRGKGNVTREEKARYDKGVDVYFQKSAWMDADVNMQWVKGTLIPGIEKGSNEKVLFADNVGFQLAEEFHQECRRKVNALVYLLPPNHTDKVQPIDAGCGKMMKLKIGEAMERWLEDDHNLDLWHDKISAKERRILMTTWVAEAWKELTAEEDLFRKLFEKTGCLMTADCSEDDKIRPQGLENYTF